MPKRKKFTQTAKEMMQAYSSGNYELALKIAEQACIDFPDNIDHPLMWRISILCRSNRTDESLQLLAKSLDEGYWWSEIFFEDEDFNDVRELPEFQRLVAISLKQRQKEVSKNYQPVRFVVEAAQGGEKPYPVLFTMHGMGGAGQTDVDFWRAASELGWLVVSLQSSQLFSMNGFCWDDLVKAEQEVLEHIEAIRSEYSIDEKQIVLGGFSQGAGLAILSSLSEKIPAMGFIGVGTWAPDVEPIAKRAKSKPLVRGYFVFGEQDHTIERADEIRTALAEAGLELADERYSDLGHEFPSNAHETMKRALQFITSK